MSVRLPNIVACSLLRPPAQDAVLKEQPLQYNKENLLNPCFVVFAKRRASS
jgi:hypothetical protein